MFACIASFYTRPWWQWVELCKIQNKSTKPPRSSDSKVQHVLFLSGSKMQLALNSTNFVQIWFVAEGHALCSSRKSSLFQWVSRLIPNAGDLTIRSYRLEISKYVPHEVDLAVSGWSCACEWQEAAASLRLSISDFCFQINQAESTHQ